MNQLLENYWIFWEYHKCVFSYLIWIVGPIMNLISGTHNYVRGGSTHCVGQFCPMFKLCGRRPGPILSSFIQMEQGRAQPNIRCEGKRISEDSQPKNGQNYRPRRGGAYLWGIGLCPRTMVTSGLLSEVSGELVNHSEQRLGRTLYQSKGGNIK